MFSQKVRLASTKKQVLNIFRLFRGSEDKDMNASVYADANEHLSQPNTFNTQAYIIARQRMHEIECQKAMAIAASRHERWKAGGPY